MANVAKKNKEWAEALLATLVALGITDCCIAPGSRSTPLTIAAADHPNINTTVHYDERGLAFFALGIAKATERPVAIITTSGSAVANLLPAVVEASQSRVPLIILSADRPPELVGVGANQAIDQAQLFGVFARRCVMLPCPDDESAIDASMQVVIEAVDYGCHADNPGPIHINCPFREPLAEPGISTSEYIAKDSLKKQIKNTLSASQQIAAISTHKIMIVAGQLSVKEAAAVLAFAKTTHTHIIADITSSLRQVKHDLIIPSHCSADYLSSDVTVIQFGDFLTSKPLLNGMKKVKEVFKVQSFRQILNPLNVPMTVYQCDILSFCADPINMLALKQGASPQVDIADVLLFSEEWSEAVIAQMLSGWLPESWGLFLGNSMTIRLWDKYAVQKYQRPSVTVTSRGASGIDGNIATSLGYAYAADIPMLACMGDLTFLHDNNSVSLAKQVSRPFVLVVINNNGGGIFQQLESANTSPHFETFFKTPHQHSVSDIAWAFGLNAYKVASKKELLEALRKSSEKNEFSCIEIVLS